jgi:hypothetical protein
MAEGSAAKSKFERTEPNRRNVLLPDLNADGKRDETPCTIRFNPAVQRYNLSIGDQLLVSDVSFTRCKELGKDRGVVWEKAAKS